MHSFHYRNGQLLCEDVALQQIASEIGTPTYVYSAATIKDHYSRLSQALSPLSHTVAYAVKANSNIAILQLLAAQGAGFDIVSAGELYRVIKAGGDASRTTFAGVGKTAEEIAYALDMGIHAFNVESEAELYNINSVAKSKGVTARVAVRVNPNVDAKTHHYISTGKAENKFGIDFEDIPALYEKIANELGNLRIVGLQMHIGSQLTSVEPFVQAIERIKPLVRELKKRYQLEYLSIGGGVGIVYYDVMQSAQPDWWIDNEKQLSISWYASKIVPLLKDLDLHIIVEPGRLLVGNAGVLLSRCVYEKHGKSKCFKIIDAGMSELIRPALYEGHHEIVPLQQPPAQQAGIIADVVGPICETGDFYAQNREVADFHAGDYVAILSAGAYGFTMSSNYNTRPLPAEIMVEGNEWSVIRQRQTLEDILKLEQLR